ncbi:MAG: 5-formyltetrahydrofolate cyclo-ligase [Candidatus Nanopelagicales bacterium]|nr:5-formyltetrahydrofolate cyclo-ligase [Candidatus Nanopelagicales bacterium]
MDKAEVRAAVRAQRAMGHTATPDLPQRTLAATPTGVVCCYVSTATEPPTPAVIEALLARGDDVYLPVAHPGGRLEWVRAETARPWQAWGVPGQPSCPGTPVQLPAVDAVIVPALALDRTGRRLGQGGGFYDRFLPTVGGARKIALVWSDEIVDNVFAEPHDARMDTWVVADG